MHRLTSRPLALHSYSPERTVPHTHARLPCHRKSRQRTNHQRALQRRQPGLQVMAASKEGAGGEGEGVEVAVFRFTLGIPGFDDALIPRAVGVVGGLLVTLNRLLGGGRPTAAQGWGEALATLLVLVCLLTPTLEQRLRQAVSGRGAGVQLAPDASAQELFQLADGLSDSAKTELAWTSFALLRNTPGSTVLAARGDGAGLLLRGTWRRSAAVSTASSLLSTVGQASRALLEERWRGGAADPGSSSVYWPTAGSRGDAAGQLAEHLPESAQSVLVQVVRGSAGEPQGLVLLASPEPRAFQRRERLWVAALAQKLLPIMK